MTNRQPAGSPWAAGARSRAPADSAQGRWCALVTGAEPVRYVVMRAAMCAVLRRSVLVADDTIALAAQLDPRTAEQLAAAYLRTYGEG